MEAKAEKGEFELSGFEAGVEGAGVEDDAVEEDEEEVSGFLARGIELARKGEAEKAVFVLGFWVSVGAAGVDGSGDGLAGVETEAKGDEEEEKVENPEAGAGFGVAEVEGFPVKGTNEV